MVKADYKQTDVGLIPKDWEVKEIGDICQIFGRIGFRGYTVNDIVTEDKGVITISPSNIVNNTTNFDKCTYISWFKYEESPEIKIFNGDILLVKTGSTVGKTAIVNNLKREATINPQIVVLKKIKVNNFYLGYLAGYKDFQNNITRTIVGGAIPTLSQKQIAGYKIPIPPEKEQKSIAKALSDTDELITSLEKLISKKEAIKQGTMQQLLTGKKRLSGFSGEWEEKTLEEIVENGGLVRGPFGGALKKEFFVSKGYKVYEQRNAIYKSIEIGSYFINEDKFQELKRFELLEGDLIVSCSGTIGKIYEIPNNSPRGVINQALLKIKLDNKKINTKFFLYIFTSNDFQSKIIDNSHGGAMPNLVGMDTFKKTTLLLPDIKEQKAIAKILSDMDNEIESLKSKLVKTKAIKDGMMSELLTGKTRLK